MQLASLTEMDIIYANYEPDKGFEEKQAEIYTKAVERYEGPLVTAVAIKNRFKRDKIKPENVRYALKPDGTPLAYIQYRAYPERKVVWLGYPWAMPGTPEKVQDKLFTDHLQYVKEKYPERIIYLGYINKKFTHIHEFAKNRGFTEIDRYEQYEITFDAISQLKSSNYQVEKAKNEDLDQIIELANSDSNFMTNFPDEDSMAAYFKDTVLPTGQAIVVRDTAGQMVATGAPLIQIVANQPDNFVLLRFSTIRQEYESAFQDMMITISDYCFKNYPDKNGIVLYVQDLDKAAKQFVETVKYSAHIVQICYKLE